MKLAKYLAIHVFLRDGNRDSRPIRRFQEQGSPAAAMPVPLERSRLLPPACFRVSAGRRSRFLKVTAPGLYTCSTNRGLSDIIIAMYEFAVAPAVTSIRRRGVAITAITPSSIGAEFELEPGDRADQR